MQPSGKKTELIYLKRTYASPCIKYVDCHQITIVLIYWIQVDTVPLYVVKIEEDPFSVDIILTLPYVWLIKCDLDR